MPHGVGTWGQYSSDIKSNPRIVNKKANSGPVIAYTEQIRVIGTDDLNLESNSELKDAASNVFWTVEPVEVEFEEGEWWCIKC